MDINLHISSNPEVDGGFGVWKLKTEENSHKHCREKKWQKEDHEYILWVTVIISSILSKIKTSVWSVVPEQAYFFLYSNCRKKSCAWIEKLEESSSNILYFWHKFIITILCIMSTHLFPEQHRLQPANNSRCCFEKSRILVRNRAIQNTFRTVKCSSIRISTTKGRSSSKASTGFGGSSSQWYVF